MTPHPADWPLPDFTRLRNCADCAGDGYVDERDYLTPDDLPVGHLAHRIDCPFCGGSGFDPDPAPTTTTRKARP